jgi:glycosyltransferase involved in cell wall biosynthesis
LNIEKKKIVIIGIGIKEVTPQGISCIGGAESQLKQLAEELGKIGHQVSLVYQGDSDSVLSFKLYSVHSIHRSWVKLSGLLSLFRKIWQINPNVIICRAASPFLFIYGLMSISVSAKILYFAAHDLELSPNPARLKKFGWQLFRLGLQFCTTIFVQNNIQEKGFKGLLLFGKQRVREIKNLPLLTPVKSPSKPGGVFTWVGTYRQHKRPEWVIKIAEQLPGIKFNIILYCWNDPEIEREFRDKFRHLDNIVFYPGVDHNYLPNIYRESLAILISSESEGFPNVAIEAWSQGRAVISTRSNVLKELTKEQGTVLVSSLNGFVRAIEENSIKDFEKIGLNGLEFFKKCYSTEDILDRIQSVF